MGAVPRRIAVLTHSYPEETAAALIQLIEAAAGAGAEVLVPPAETRKHALDVERLPAASQSSAVLDADAAAGCDLCVVLGGDGTILEALRLFARRDVPVFGVNFGRIGFLATADQAELAGSLTRALAGDFDVLALPALIIDVAGGERAAFNDVGFHRRPDGQVAELAFAVGGEEVSSVRCDGLVAATPAGSTGYNLANGGPILAWGVKGYVVSFIAPHTLTARPLVVAPRDVLCVRNMSAREGIDVAVDGRQVAELPPGGSVKAAFRDGVGCLAQLPATSFYHRFREKFGRLTT